MGPSRITVISVVAVPSGWEARHHGEVLYWGPSLDRTVREARRYADVYDAHVVVQGLLDDLAGAEPLAPEEVYPARSSRAEPVDFDTGDRLRSR